MYFLQRANASSLWSVTKLTKQGLHVLHILDGVSQGVLSNERRMGIGRDHF